ncbi:MAG: Holliday junction branch migration protein RuvA [Burkholderiales bacterium]|nr:Holliday junction branch migration protein RuvA [Burkholderiales bacterium]
MIGSLYGKIVAVKPPQVMIIVNGVGYEVDLPIPDCATLVNNQEEVLIYTHLVVREDAHLLYGFINIESRDCFRTLIKVSGIGPRIALALLSTLSPSQLQIALDQTDVTTLSRTPGIGKKMAERMILELKGKLCVEDSNDLADNGVNGKYGNSMRLDIANALMSLGYNDRETNRVMQQLPLDIIDLSIGIKDALKLLNK